MNWEALGAIGELVGAAAVVLTLAYLAIQIRHSTKLARADAHERAVTYWSSATQPLLEPEFAELFQNGCESYETLSATDQMRFATLISNMIFSFELAMEKQQHGFANADLIASFERYFEQLVTKPGVREFLEQNRDFYTSVFHEWLGKVENKTHASKH
ncbi:MAG: hypothetical protein ACU84Q_13875 [Gammaproteobacteria bacterium]